MRSHDLTPGRMVGVVFDHGEDFFTALADACRAHGIRQGYIPVFIAGFSSAQLVGTCQRLSDPQAPVWSHVDLANIEVLGGGTIAWDDLNNTVQPHIHVTAGLKEHSATAHTSHLLAATVQFLTEMLIIEVEQPTMHRWPNPDLYDVPQLHLGPRKKQARPDSVIQRGSMLAAPAVLGANSDAELGFYINRGISVPLIGSDAPRDVGPADPALSQSMQKAILAELLPAGDVLRPLAAMGRRIGQTMVEDLAARVHRLRLADDVLAGGDLIAPAFRELRAAARLYRDGTHSEKVGRALLTQVGELAQVAGWIASDAGHHDLAEHAYQFGLTAARPAPATGNSSLTTNSSQDQQTAVALSTIHPWIEAKVA